MNIIFGDRVWRRIVYLSKKRHYEGKMSNYFLISGFVLMMLFVLFQVLTKTLNGIVNYLLRIEFLLQTEYDYRREELDVQMILDLDLDSLT
jgi:hypothetical protein